MNRSEILQKIRIYYQQLMLIEIYPHAFGSDKERKKKIDKILDEIIKLKKELKKL